MLTYLFAFIVFVFFILLLALLVLILVLSIFLDYQKSKRYKKSVICPGIIVRSLDRVKIDEYGSGPLHTRRISCEKYLARYTYKDSQYESEVSSEKTGLLPGTPFDVHIYDDNGKIIVCEEVYHNRFKQLIISFVLAVILSIIIICLQKQGIL